MTTKKRLKRGLPELSPLISPVLPPPSPLFPKPYEHSETKEQTAFAIASEPAGGGVSSRVGGRAGLVMPTMRSSADGEEARPEFISVAFISFSDAFSVRAVLKVTRALHQTFERLFFLTLDPTPSRYQTLVQSLPIPNWELMIHHPDIYLQALDERLTFGYVPAGQLKSVLRPNLQGQAMNGFSVPRTSVAVLDSVMAHAPFQLTACDRALFHFLDHCVLVVEADGTKLLQAYEWLRRACCEDPGFLCSILLVGEGAQPHSEFVYERFSEMVSTFLSRELGFLGWMEGDSLRLNTEFLLEGAAGAVHRATKQILLQALFEPLHPC